MNLEEAKAQVKKEWDARHEGWRLEAQERIKDGTAEGLDLLFGQPIYQPNWFERIWWPVRRWVIDKLWHRHLYYDGKNFLQRGRRGWGYQDCWNANSYLANIITPMLREMAEIAHGHPCEVIDHDGTVIYRMFWDEKTGEEHDEGGDGFEIWKATLRRIADGFEAAEYLHEQGWMHETEAEKELLRMREEGFKLLINNWDALWD